MHRGAFGLCLDHQLLLSWVASALDTEQGRPQLVSLIQLYRSVFAFCQSERICKTVYGSQPGGEYRQGNEEGSDLLMMHAASSFSFCYCYYTDSRFCCQDSRGGKRENAQKIGLRIGKTDNSGAWKLEFLMKAPKSL